jgi:hypothetical protein
LIGLHDAEYFSDEFCIAKEEVTLSKVDRIIEIKKTVTKNRPSIFFIFLPFHYFPLGTGGGGMGGVEAYCGVFL